MRDSYPLKYPWGTPFAEDPLTCSRLPFCLYTEAGIMTLGRPRMPSLGLNFLLPQSGASDLCSLLGLLGVQMLLAASGQTKPVVTGLQMSVEVHLGARMGLPILVSLSSAAAGVSAHPRSPGSKWDGYSAANRAFLHLGQLWRATGRQAPRGGGHPAH